MLLSASHQEITLVPIEYKARQPQDRSGQFGEEKDLFLLQGFKSQITETAACSLYYATLAPLRAEVTTIMESLQRR